MGPANTPKQVRNAGAATESGFRGRVVRSSVGAPSCRFAQRVSSQRSGRPWSSPLLSWVTWMKVMPRFVLEALVMRAASPSQLQARGRAASRAAGREAVDDGPRRRQPGLMVSSERRACDCLPAQLVRARSIPRPCLRLPPRRPFARRPTEGGTFRRSERCGRGHNSGRPC